MDISKLVERFGDNTVLALVGLLVGVAFGVTAQRSRFCLRAAVIEFSRGVLGARVAIWVLAFSAAVTATQLAIWWGILDVSTARQIEAPGSLSGALIGGAMFGTGMILARGCASRLLVLSATGNLRALVTGMILTIVAQASLRGVLSPAREALAGIWTIEGGSSRNLLSWLGAGPIFGVLLGCLWLGIGFWLARRNTIGRAEGLMAIGVGVVVAAGWIATYAMTLIAFVPVKITSVTFTGPSAGTMMGLINETAIPLGFDTGLVPGVFIGSMATAALGREFVLQGFEGGPSMLRYFAGAVLMGFGGMLAGGCAVGAGMTGGAIFALTGWTALAAMWLGAGLTDLAVDRRPGENHERRIAPRATV